MESSDDSSVWTDASSANTDGDDSSTEDTMKVKHYESESEKNYKKKLHKKLFKTEPEIKHELLNGDRVKHEADSDAPASPAPPSPPPPPAAAASPPKRKRKRERSPSLDADAKPALDYLDARVKQERLALTSDSQDEPAKKKKAKKKKERKESSEMIIEDKFTAEETVVETRPERNTSTSMDIDCYNEPVENLTKTEKKKKKKKRKESVKHDSENESTMVEVAQYDNDESEILTQDTYENNLMENTNDRSEILDNSANSKKKKTSTKKSTKISDCLQFEDGEDIIAACNEAIENKVSAQSSKLRRFLKANPHLHSITSTHSTGDPLISQDDDIWLFNCPHEMNISSLKDTSLSLDNKCKIKIDNQTFIGNVECEVNRAAILTYEHSRPVIKSFVINGIVNFRKRIPKAHYLEDNIISNNQTDFISLPDTKCRHPLFGPDYKKAIKIPAAVKTRLENPPLESLSVPKEGKKKKKRKYKVLETSEDAMDGEGDGEGEGGERLERKRRRSERDPEPDQPAKKKAKRIKLEQASEETWDSEKAIEENLFNF